jgi:hypothetical protein
MVAFLRDYLQRAAAEPGPARSRPVRVDRGSLPHASQEFLSMTEGYHIRICQENRS